VRTEYITQHNKKEKDESLSLVFNVDSRYCFRFVSDFAFTHSPFHTPSAGLCIFPRLNVSIMLSGSVFDLANDSPRWGFGITFSVATVSLTLCGGLFWASILKAKAETEADDEKYMRGN
jgi:hypothetical protein